MKDKELKLEETEGSHTLGGAYQCLSQSEDTMETKRFTQVEECFQNRTLLESVCVSWILLTMAPWR